MSDAHNSLEEYIIENQSRLFSKDMSKHDKLEPTIKELEF